MLTPGQLYKIMSSLNSGFCVSEDAEISLECNPGTADLIKLKEYKKLGINRLSIGLQSFSDSELRTLGRIHDRDRFILMYSDARKAGFENVNIDIMSAIPGQDLKSYKKTLTELVSIDPEHISSYSLIIEEGTKFHDLYDHDTNVIDGKKLPSEDEERQMYYMTRCVLKQAGYNRYEISNYAKDGYECRHNNVYWTGGEYLGTGLGASSYFRGYRYKNVTDMSAYLKLYGKDGIDVGYYITNADGFIKDDRYHPYAELLGTKDKMEEYMFLGLRRMAGISAGQFKEMFGLDIKDVYGAVIEKLIADGLMIMTGDMIKLTDYGIDVSNVVLSNFLLD